jgi:hypothetical protein
VSDADIMIAPRDLMLRLRAPLSPRRLERDLHDEMTFQIEREARKTDRSGRTPRMKLATGRGRDSDQ